MPKNIYKLKDGTLVPGTTTICDLLGKGDGITNWSHKIAYKSTIELTHELWVRYGGTEKLYIPRYEGIQKWQDVRDSAGDIGTLVHEAVIKFFLGETIDLSDKLVSACYGKFLSWWYAEGDDAKMVLAETKLVSEKLAFGGQPDLYIRMNGRNRLIDIKTGGKWVYDDWWLQLAGYDILLRENGYKVDEYQILWLPKDNRFDCPIRTDLRKEKKIFKHLLGIYQLRRAE